MTPRITQQANSAPDDTVPALGGETASKLPVTPRTAGRRGWLEEAKEALLELFLPARCAHCGGFGELLCDECAATLAPLADICDRCGSAEGAGLSVPYCGECVAAGFAFQAARSAFVYRDAARSLVVGLKGAGLRSLAPLMTELAWPACTEVLDMAASGGSQPDGGRPGPIPPGPASHGGNPPGATQPGGNPLGATQPIPERSVLFTWVPAHGSVQRRRGYNQAEVLARRLARTAECEARALVRKTVRTGHQQSLDRRGRRENLKGAFAAASGRPPDETKAVILVDDVYTTGATANEVSAVIKGSFGLPVYVLTFCRTPGAGSIARD